MSEEVGDLHQDLGYIADIGTELCCKTRTTCIANNVRVIADIGTQGVSPVQF